MSDGDKAACQRSKELLVIKPVNLFVTVGVGVGGSLLTCVSNSAENYLERLGDIDIIRESL